MSAGFTSDSGRCSVHRCGGLFADSTATTVSAGRTTRLDARQSLDHDRLVVVEGKHIADHRLERGRCGVTEGG
jgi:hypothetical protein